MCFLVFSYAQHPRYRLVLAANRDEFYDRPTAPAAFWDDAPDVLAGRDLKGGGTWMGITRTGRFAALTNYRDPASIRSDAPTRGALVANFLTGTASPRAYLEHLRPEAARYNGFNLLVADADNLLYFNNQTLEIQTLAPGLYGLSNHLLDTPWPKVMRGKARLADLVAPDEADVEALLALLADDDLAPDDRLPDTGVGTSWERVLSSIFIKSENYGTRSSSIVLVDYAGHVTFVERTHRPANGTAPGTRTFEFQTVPAPQSI